MASFLENIINSDLCNEAFEKAKEKLGETKLGSVLSQLGVDDVDLSDVAKGVINVIGVAKNSVVTEEETQLGDDDLEELEEEELEEECEDDVDNDDYSDDEEEPGEDEEADEEAEEQEETSGGLGGLLKKTIGKVLTDNPDLLKDVVGKIIKNKQ